MLTTQDIFVTSIEPGGLAISPDGGTVGMAYVRVGRYRIGFFDVAGDEPAIEIELDCGRPGGLAWSPDGRAVAFYADEGESSEANVFVCDVATCAIEPVMAEPGWQPWIPSWSPDCTKLAFSACGGEEGRPRLFLASLQDGTVNQLTNGDCVDRAPRFSPDGRTLVFRRGWEVWLYSLADGSQRQLIVEQGHDFEPHFGCFSPDGLRFVVARNSVDGGQVLIVDVDAGVSRALTDGTSVDLRPSWSPAGDAISFVRNRERMVVVGLDGTTLWEASPDNGRILAGPNAGPQWAGNAELLTFLDGEANAWVAGPGVPARQVTRFPERPRVKQQPKQVRYPTTGNVEVPALLIEPKGYVRGRSPAVVWLHGGGSTAASDLRTTGAAYLLALLEAGFLVLLPDYRGSSGHGEKWEWVLPENRGMVDVDDVVAAKRYLEESGLAAPGRVGVAGYSYGGYLTLMALARSDAGWACAVSLWGIFDPLRLRPAFANDQHGQHMPDLTDQTPLNLLDQMHAPLLILHGEQDGTSATWEAIQTREALLSRGVTCDVHVFQDTHGLPLSTGEAARLLVSFMRKRCLSV